MRYECCVAVKLYGWLLAILRAKCGRSMWSNNVNINLQLNQSTQPTHPSISVHKHGTAAALPDCAGGGARLAQGHHVPTSLPSPAQAAASTACHNPAPHELCTRAERCDSQHITHTKHHPRSTSDAVQALQARLARLLRRVANLCASHHSPLTLTSCAPRSTGAVPVPPTTPTPLTTALHEFDVSGEQLARAATEARSAVEPLQMRATHRAAAAVVQPPAWTTLEALLPAIRYPCVRLTGALLSCMIVHRDTEALHASSGLLSGMVSVGMQQHDALPSFFGAPANHAAQPGQHLPVLSSMDTRPRVVQSFESEDDAPT